MAYDEDLATRLRGLLGERTEPGALAERRMFGGLALLVGGHMAVCATGDGLMVRVPRPDTAELLATTAATPMVMRGRELAGWVVVAGDAVTDDDALAEWVDRGLATVGSLPPR